MFTKNSQPVIQLAELDHDVIPKSIRTVLPMLDIENGPWIAGGAARRWATGDLNHNGDTDFYFKSAQQMNDFIENSPWTDDANKQKTQTKTFDWDKHRVQTVGTRFFDSLGDVLHDFDFTICMFGTDGRHLYSTQQAVDDHQERLLRLNPMYGNRYRAYRIAKYTMLGFRPVPGMMGEMVSSIAAANDGRVVVSDWHY